MDYLEQIDFGRSKPVTSENNTLYDINIDNTSSTSDAKQPTSPVF